MPPKGKPDHKDAKRKARSEVRKMKRAAKKSASGDHVAKAQETSRIAHTKKAVKVPAMAKGPAAQLAATPEGRASIRYASALADPWKWGQGTRVPDLLRFPTATTRIVTRLTVNNSATLMTRILVCPNLTNVTNAHINVATAAAGAAYGAGTNYAASSAGTALATVSGFYRPVCMGARLVNNSPALSRQGVISVNRCYYPPVDLTANAPQLAGIPTTATYLVTNDAGADVRATWLPATLEDTDFNIVAGTVGTGFIVFELETSATVNNYDLEVTLDVEYIPKVAYLGVIETASVSGDPGSTAKAWDLVTSAAGGASGAANEVMQEALARGADKLMGLLAGKAVDYSIDRIGSFMGGGLGVMSSVEDRIRTRLLEKEAVRRYRAELVGAASAESDGEVVAPPPSTRRVGK